MLVNPTDYFLYLPLLPEVAAGLLDPRRICVSLPAQLPRRPAGAGRGRPASTCRNRRVALTGPRGQRGRARRTTGWCWPSAASTSCCRSPASREHAHGFRGIPEALYLRDHIIRQVELADATRRPGRARRPMHVRRRRAPATPAPRSRRRASCSPGAWPTAPGAGRHQRMRWLLVDLAPRVLPELDPRLSRTADRVLRRRGVEVRTGQSVEEAPAPTAVRLTDRRGGRRPGP